MSYCELCGCQITGKGIPIVVENVVMNVCGPCSKHGKRPYQKKVAGRGERREKKKRTRRQTTEVFTSVRDDYSSQIRTARRKLGLTEDELGEKMGENGSVVVLLEKGKFKPDAGLARRLEGLLGVSLLEEEVHEQQQ
ncbi:MAG: multiprotein bridging factor aMBF1, partial [Nitrososphaerales archaeon]